MAFTSLAYLFDWLKDACRCTRKDGAAGVDGVTAEQYEQDLEGNLQSLLDRAKSGTYQAPPVRRVHMPKGGSTTETRPLRIPTCSGHVTGSNLRAGLRGLLVWIPTWPLGTRCIDFLPRPDDAPSADGRNSFGGRYPEVFR